MLHSRFEDSLVVGVLVQKLQDLHQALGVPKRTQAQESHGLSSTPAASGDGGSYSRPVTIITFSTNFTISGDDRGHFF